MKAFRGALGGFFESLGFTGIGAMILGMIVFVFVHGYVSGIVASKIAAIPENITADEYTKAELYTTIPLVAIPLGFGVWSQRQVIESDTRDAVGCFLGGGMLYEIANAIEIGAAKVGVWT